MSDQRTITIDAGHVSLEVGTTAAGKPQYSVKFVIPTDPDRPVSEQVLADAVAIGLRQLEAAEAQLAAKYSQGPAK